MSALAAVTTLLAVLTALHLFVTYGLVRRLRAHTDLLDQLTTDTSRLVPDGTPLPAFTTQTIDGDTLHHTQLQHPAALALLAVNCPHCRTNLPEFVAYIRGAGYRREQVLAVVTADDGADPTARQDMLDALASVATVVLEPSGGTVTTALNAEAFPTFYLTHPDATVASGTHAVRKLPNTTHHSPSPPPLHDAIGQPSPG